MANNVNASGNEDAASIAVALSGTDSDGSVTRLQAQSTLPGNGALFVNGVAAVIGIDYVHAGTSVTFTPAANYNGQVSFQYLRRTTAVPTMPPRPRLRSP